MGGDDNRRAAKAPAACLTSLWAIWYHKEYRYSSDYETVTYSVTAGPSRTRARWIQDSGGYRTVCALLDACTRRAHNPPSSRHGQTSRSFPEAAQQFARRSRPHDLAGAHAVHAEPLRSLRVEPELQDAQRGDGEVLHSGRRAASGGADLLRSVHSEAPGEPPEEELASDSLEGKVAEIQSHYASLIATIQARSQRHHSHGHDTALARGGSRHHSRNQRKAASGGPYQSRPSQARQKKRRKSFQ